MPSKASTKRTATTQGKGSNSPCPSCAKKEKLLVEINQARRNLYDEVQRLASKHFLFIPSVNETLEIVKGNVFYSLSSPFTINFNKVYYGGRQYVLKEPIIEVGIYIKLALLFSPTTTATKLIGFTLWKDGKPYYHPHVTDWACHKDLINKDINYNCLVDYTYKHIIPALGTINEDSILCELNRISNVKVRTLIENIKSEGRLAFLESIATYKKGLST